MEQRGHARLRSLQRPGRAAGRQRRLRGDLGRLAGCAARRPEPARAAGRNGLWLLDPNDIRISSSGPDVNISTGPNFSSTADGSVLSVATLAAALNAGNSVTVATATAGANTQAGNILADSIALSVNPPSPVSLTLDAHADILINGSSLVSTGAALTLNFDATTGIHLDHVTVNAAGGDLIFGSSRDICTALQGCQTMISTLAQPGGFAGLRIDASTLDAGRIFGGGSALGSTTATRIADSTLRARDIGLNARSEGAAAIEMAQNVVLEASHRLLVDGRTDSGANGVAVGPGSTLSVVDPTAAADSLLHLQGFNLSTSGGNGLLLIGGQGGSATQTLIRVQGAELKLEGQTNTQGSSIGVGLYGFGDFGSRGLQIDARQARPGATVTLSGTNNRGITDGHSYLFTHVAIAGPDDPGGKLELLGIGGRNTGLVGSLLSDVDISTKAPFEALSDGFYFNQVKLQGGGDISLRTRTGIGDPAGAMVYLLDSELSTTGSSATIRMEGSDGGAVRGGGQGAGIDFGTSQLLASGSASRIQLHGRGGSLGSADGISMQGSELKAASISLTGLGEGGDGLRIRSSTLDSIDLQLNGRVSDTQLLRNNAGIRIAEGSTLQFGLGGSVSLTGDNIGIFNSQVKGAPASFSLQADRSIAVRFSDLDFSQGPGTRVTFTSDADSDLSGRVRVDFGSLMTGGGDLTITGGTGAAVGLPSFDANNNPVQGNAVVFEGATGVLLQGVNIQAGTGTVKLRGRGESLVAPAADSTGSWGINVMGGVETSIAAGRIELFGDGGAKGWGLLVSGSPDISQGAAGTALNLRATDIEVLVNGVGLELDRYTGGLQANGLMPKPALELADTNSIWQASNSLKITAPQGGILLHGAQLSAASMELNASATLSLDRATLSASQGAISLRAGTTQGGELKVVDSSVSAATQLSLYGEAAIIHNELSGVRMGGGALLQAPQVQITGIAMGNTAGVNLLGLGGRILAGNTLSISGSHKLASDDHDGFSLNGNWLLQAGDTVSIRSERNMAFPDERAQDPRVVAGKLVDIQLLNVLPVHADELDDLSSFGAVLAGMPASALTRITLTGTPVTLRTSASLPSRIEVRIDDLTLAPGAALRSTAPGDAITLLGADGSSPLQRFSNEAGANALQTPNGRWLVFMDQGSTGSLGALSPSFTQYSLSPAAFSRDAGGSLLVSATGSGAFYRSGPPSSSASVAPAAVDNQVALGTALTQSTPTVQLSTPGEGRTLDALPGVAQGSGGASFTPINSSQMSRAELITLLAARDNYKKKVFADALHRLQLDPALADVRPCTSEPELASGQCLITEALKAQIQAARLASAAPQAAPAGKTQTGLERLRRAQARKVREAALPNIARKVALLIGVNDYQDDRVPDLSGALTDVRAVQQLLEDQLGYDTVTLEDASKEAMVRALNQLALETDGNDSVLIYYAGHGVVEPGTNMGYWLPADSRADQPQSWLSNADIARLVGLIGARQALLVSDSCYSGTLAGSEKVQVDRSAAPDSLLSRKAVVVLSSGGNEPVADTGRDGHSVFAWHLMERLKQLSAWQIGNQLYERIRFEVAREFPQTPRYGAARAAGHQDNTDYLFEKRSLEK
ncbi:MAG: caspase family protein [Inhella sp.]